MMAFTCDGCGKTDENSLGWATIRTEVRAPWPLKSDEIGLQLTEHYCGDCWHRLSAPLVLTIRKRLTRDRSA